MNHKRIIIFILIVGSFFVFASFKRVDDPINKIAAQLDDWLSSHPQEKVYLQLDKPYYAIGDDIWFKAYIVTGSNHRLSALSGVLNVELIDDRDSVKQSIKLPAINGSTWGSFALPDTLKEGNYRIRAYTNYMRNAGEDYYFDKTIVIANSISNNVFTNTTYSYNTQNGKQTANAVINYYNLDGQPYNNTPVNYKVQLGQATAANGKTQTDDKGNLSISFDVPDKEKAGRIETELRLTDKKRIVKSVILKAATSKIDLQFFPEGGNLVNNATTKISFKAIGADGLGTSINGVVIDNHNKQVAAFTTANLGMGVFNLKPEKDKTYKAVITNADGSTSVFDLPAATDSGYSLVINDAGPNNLSINVTPGPAVKASTLPTDVISLIAQSGGTIYYAGKSKPGLNSFNAIIPKDKFPSGIVQFTLFSPTAEPMNERLVFIRNDDQLKLGLTAGKTYKPREKVKIDIAAADKNSKPAVGSFSVSVIDESKVHVDAASENSIITNLLLTSDLKGYIEKPESYFNNINEHSRDYLDILMLTQGYRRFIWKEVIANNSPPIKYQPEKTLAISGFIKTPFGKAVANGRVTLLSTAGGTLLADTVSDKRGHFVFENLVFKDSIKFLIQARTAEGRKNLVIDLDTVRPQKVGKNKNTPDLQVNISQGLTSYLENSRSYYSQQLRYGFADSTILLKEVEIKEKKKVNPVENSSNLNGPGNASQVISGESLGNLDCATIVDCLTGRLHGVIFDQTTNIPYCNLSDYRLQMLVLVDGAAIFPYLINQLNPLTIASVEVLSSLQLVSIYGTDARGGVIIITTKQGTDNFNYQRNPPGVTTYKAKGYYKSREFYSPGYSTIKVNSQLADLRSTIYWKPDIITDKNGKASVEYFNADGKGTYRVVVEGIDSEGNLGRAVYRYEVK